MSGTVTECPKTEISLGMSNFDHSIDEGFEEAIKKDSVFGRHAGWNFNGRVYWSGTQFCEDVWVFGSYQKTIKADTLTDLMSEVNDEFGSE
jgi:hypothetical protein